jgi:hypothetical protein
MKNDESPLAAHLRRLGFLAWHPPGEGRVSCNRAKREVSHEGKIEDHRDKEA